MMTNFYVRAGDRYYGLGRVGFFPANCWGDGWVEALRQSGEGDGTLVWDRDVDSVVDASDVAWSELQVLYWTVVRELLSGCRHCCAR